jgi:hypothetical protein
MSKARHRALRDVYRFPGLVPAAGVRGVFGDPMAVVVSLTRRQKKRRAAFVDDGTGATTTSGSAGSATCPAATSACISSWRCGGLRVGAAAR